jgi:hypothetical protein
MKRIVAAALAASLMALLPTAACADAQAAVPFEPVPLEHPAGAPHRLAYATLATGAGLIGLSFALTHRADRLYAEYLAGTDPSRLGRLYDDSIRYDRLSAAALLTGESLLALGVWLRFLQRPPQRQLSWIVEPGRCGVALRF